MDRRTDGEDARLRKVTRRVAIDGHVNCATTNARLSSSLRDLQRSIIRRLFPEVLCDLVNIFRDATGVSPLACREIYQLGRIKLYRFAARWQEREREGGGERARSISQHLTACSRHIAAECNPIKFQSHARYPGARKERYFNNVTY